MIKPSAASLSHVEVIRLVDHGVKFLYATSTRPAILAEMARLGYTREAHAEGWKLLLAMLGHNSYPLHPGALTTPNTSLGPALAGLDSFRASELKRAEAALNRCYPAQAKFLLGRASEQSPAPASAVVSTFLDRYVELRDRGLRRRGANRKQDSGAIALLLERNVMNPSIERQLRDWIELAQSPAASAPPIDDSARKRVLAEAAIAFKAWFDDWRVSACIGIHRKDYLIALGLASRKPKTGANSKTGQQKAGNGE